MPRRPERSNGRAGDDRGSGPRCAVGTRSECMSLVLFLREVATKELQSTPIEDRIAGRAIGLRALRTGDPEIIRFPFLQLDAMRPGSGLTWRSSRRRVGGLAKWPST